MFKRNKDQETGNGIALASLTGSLVSRRRTIGGPVSSHWIVPEAFEPLLKCPGGIQRRVWSAQHKLLVQDEARVQTGVEDGVQNNQVWMYFFDHFLTALKYRRVF